MKHESVAGLIKDFTVQLSTLAAEFGARAELVAQVPAGEESETPSYRDIAQTMLDQRMARLEHFSADLFHEPAWDMLLALFVAHEDLASMNVKALVACSKAPATTSQRWIDHLHHLRMIDRVIDTGDRRRIEISLSDHGDQAMRAYFAGITRGEPPILAKE